MAGLWKFLRLRGENIFLVLAESAYGLLQGVVELSPLPNDGIICFGAATRGAFSACLSRVGKQWPGAIFHLVMAAPWEAPAACLRPTLYTLPISGFPILNWRGRLGATLGAILATRVDLLEAKVLKTLSHWLPYKKGAFSVTPSSFVDLDYFQPGEQKQNHLVFCGLFSQEKQIFGLVRALPQIHQSLLARGIEDCRFFLLGRDVGTPAVAELCGSLCPSVPVTVGFEPDPRKILAHAKVFFSLQRQTNYPSKALLEALACGCLPIVTDTGDSERIAPRADSFYVPLDFTAEDLSDACAQALGLGVLEREQRVRRFREFLRVRFSLERMADYYQGHYDQLRSL